MANGRGGKRPGAGRKPISEEMKSRDLAISAIAEKYGNIKQGLISLLNTGEPTLVKFVFEHAVGKPTDKIDLTTRVEETRIVDVDDDGDEMVDGLEGDQDDDDQEYQDEIDDEGDGDE